MVKTKSSSRRQSSEGQKKGRFPGLNVGVAMVSRKKSSQAKSSSPRAQYVNESDHLAKSRAVENDPNATPLEVLHARIQSRRFSSNAYMDDMAYSSEEEDFFSD